MNNYPLGTKNDPRAPWNQKETPKMEVEVWASNTLSRTALLTVDDYNELPPNAETDEEGHTTYTHNIDFSECNLQGQFNNQCYTIKEILDELRMTVDDINSHGLNDVNLNHLNRLAREGEYWTVDEEEVTIA